MNRTDYSTIRLTASKAIRAKCMDCTCQQQAEVRNCTIKTCPLWRYRMGREQRDELYTRKPASEKNLIIAGSDEEIEVSDDE